MSESDEVESRREKKKRRRLKVDMEVLTETPDRIAPVVGYFPSGYNPENSDEAPDVRVFKKMRPTRMDLVVRPKESNVEFVGKSYSGEAAGRQLCTYALGVLDKESQTLKIVPIAANKIFRLEPRVLKSLTADVEPSQELSEDVVAAEKTGRVIQDLTSLYGTKKDRSKDKRWKSLAQQTQDPSAREHLKELMLQTDASDEAPKDTKETAGPNVPPHDFSAVTPEKAYPLDEIIPKVERDYLFDILELLQSGVGEQNTFWEENYYPSFVINRIPKLREIQDEEEKNKYACILSYITHLVNFQKIAVSYRPYGFHGEAVNKYKIPQLIYQKFMTMFVDPATNVLSSEKKELIIGYILVLTLFADDFKSNPSDIAKDLGMSVLNLRPYYLQLGCRTVQYHHFEKGAMTLSVPLKLANPKRLRRNR